MTAGFSELAGWIDAIPDLRQRLECGGTALDLECGSGEAAIALALAFPRARVFGFDASPERVMRARERARALGLDGRMRFAVIDWTSMPMYGFDMIARFDLLFLGAPGRERLVCYHDCPVAQAAAL